MLRHYCILLLSKVVFMFRKIHLITLDVASPIRAANYEERLKNLDNELPADMMNVLQSDFLLTGKVHVLMSLPAAPNAYKHLLSIQSFILIEADARYFTKRQNYDSFLLLFTYGGEGTLNYDGVTYTMKENEGFFIDCRKPHEYYTSSDYWYHSDLHFNGASAACIYQEFDREHAVKFHVSTRDIYQTQLESLLLDYTNASAHRRFYVSAHLHALLSFILQETEKQHKSVVPDTIRYLLKYMESNHTNPLTLDQLAAFSGLSKYHLSREFKKYTGYSPNDYLIELRLAHAKLLLSNTTLPSYKIGMIVGIPNEANFLRLFKQKTGMTPGTFRTRKDE